MDHSPPILFDRARLRKRRARAMRGMEQHDFLLREAAARLVESLESMSYSFPTIVELGSSGALAPHLASRTGTTNYIACDLVAHGGVQLVADEERLPFAPASLDAVVSAGGLHWANDLPGVLAQIRTALKPDGLFMAILPGPDTLRELRQAFAQADAARSGSITARIAPFPDVRDAGALLQRTGFALPVVDRDLFSVSYENIFALMGDLRGSAQSNMLQHQLQHFTPRGFFMETAKRYPTDKEGRINATFEFVTMTAWAPAATQQQPAKRGSGKISLTKALN